MVRLRHHKHLEDRKGRYEAGFIIEEILGPRPETPLLDDIATEEQLKQLEEQRKKTDDILSNWRTPPGSPWERNEDTTFDSSSLSWDTDNIAPRDDIIVPNAWDEGEETADEIWTTANEESTAGEEEDDSLPELVSGSEDSGRPISNLPNSIPIQN